MQNLKKLTAVITTALLAVALGLLSGCGIISGELWTYVDYDNEGAYTIGGGEITHTVSDIFVNWSDDSVTVTYYDGALVKIEESADKEIESDLTLRYLVDNGKLTVQYATNGRHDIRGLNKKLNVLIPDGAALDTLTVKSVTGNIECRVDADALTADSISGNITVSQESPANIIAKSISGNIDVSFNGVATLFVNTISGNVNITLPDTFGFKLTLETLSGELNSGLELIQNDKEYTRLEGGAVFTVYTLSGNVNIAKKS